MGRRILFRQISGELVVSEVDFDGIAQAASRSPQRIMFYLILAMCIALTFKHIWKGKRTALWGRIADRRQQPVAFWLLIGLDILVMAILTACIIRYPGMIK